MDQTFQSYLSSVVTGKYKINGCYIRIYHHFTVTSQHYISGRFFLSIGTSFTYGIRELVSALTTLTWPISPEIPERDVPVPAGQNEDVSCGALDTAGMFRPAAWGTSGNTGNHFNY